MHNDSYPMGHKVVKLNELEDNSVFTHHHFVTYHKAKQCLSIG